MQGYRVEIAVGTNDHRWQEVTLEVDNDLSGVEELDLLEMIRKKYPGFYDDPAVLVSFAHVLHVFDLSELE